MKQLKGVTLRDYQKLTVSKGYKNNRHLIAYDTGMGKTYTGLSVVYNKVADGYKYIWFGPLSVLKGTLKDVQSKTDLKVKLISKAGFDDTYETLKDYDILLVGFEAMDYNDVRSVISELWLKEVFTGLVIDEVQLISNVNASDRNSIIYYMALNAKSHFLMSATPLISKRKQYAYVLTMLYQDPVAYFSYLANVTNGNFSIHTSHDDISFKIRDTNYKVILHNFDVLETKVTSSGTALFRFTRNNKYAYEAVKNIIEENRELGKNKFIIYCYLTENQPPLKEFVESLGYSCMLVNGNTDNSDVEKKFLNYDCAIYSINAGINLPADYCIMYDWNIYAHQAVGRGLRTLDASDYKAYFMLSSHPKEQATWENSLVSNLYLFNTVVGTTPLKEILDMEYDEFEED